MSSQPLRPGSWVRIHRIELAPAERAVGIPEDSRDVPFESWINGWLVEEAGVGERACIRTATGRMVEGELVEAEPGYRHTFGSPPAVLQRAGERARLILFTEDER